MARPSSRRRFLKQGSLFVPAAFAILRARGQNIMSGPIMRTMAGGGAGTGLKTNLVGYWKYDEESTGDRADSYDSLTLTSDNAVGYTTGILNNCCNFTSASSQRLRSTDTAFNLGADTAFTWSVWAKMKAVSTTPVICRLEGVAQFTEYILEYSGSSDRWRCRIGNGTSSATVYADNYGIGTTNWVHLCCWHDPTANEVGIAVNANSETPTSWSGGTQNRNRTFYVCYNEDSATYGNVYVDEMAFWKDRVLTSGDRTTLYNAGTPLSYDSW